MSQPITPKEAGAKILSLNQLKAKKFKFLDDVPEKIKASFGMLIKNFILIIYGDSGNGKSNLLIQLLKCFATHGRCLYVALEEGHGYSMQKLVNEYLGDEYSGKVVFADHTMTYQRLWERLEGQRKEQFIFIDSIQYWNINYEMYKKMKEKFPTKTFVFISHAKGKKPEGKTACDIEYDATIKVRVEGYIGFMKSRLGGNKPYVIWEGDETEGAKFYWGKEYNKKAGLVKPKTKKEKKQAIKNETVQNESKENKDTNNKLSFEPEGSNGSHQLERSSAGTIERS